MSIDTCMKTFDGQSDGQHYGLQVNQINATQFYRSASFTGVSHFFYSTLHDSIVIKGEMFRLPGSKEITSYEYT